MKWCNRIVKECIVNSSESSLRITQDAIDIFCCSIGDSSMYYIYIGLLFTCYILFFFGLTIH